MIKIIKNVNANKLHDELITSCITPIAVLIHPDESVELRLSDDVDMTAVQAVIDAHNPTPLPPLPTKEGMIEQELANTNALILELTEIILGGM